MTSGVVVGGVFFTGDELFGVEQLAVCAGTDLIYYCGFQIYEHRPGDVLSGTGFAEEGVETVVTSSDGFVRGHLTVGLDSMFQTVQFPAGVTNLDSGLTDMD